MLCNMCLGMLYNVFQVLYNRCHVVSYVMLYNMCHFILYKVSHVMLCYVT